MATRRPLVLSGGRMKELPPGDEMLGAGVIPLVEKTVNYTLEIDDAGVFHPGSDTTARTFTIPSDASVPYPQFKALTFLNQHGGGVVTIAINSDVMRLAGAGTTGSRTLAANGVATAIKVAATEWIISGVGLT